jgi:protein SCO1/2
VLIFGIWAVPKIVDRFKKSDLVDIGKVPAFELTDQDNKKISDSDYKGKVYVVEFFFSTCPTICPKMNQNMLQLQEAFYGRPDFGIASITIDPAHDTPAVLKAHGKLLGLSIITGIF